MPNVPNKRDYIGNRGGHLRFSVLWLIVFLAFVSTATTGCTYLAILEKEKNLRLRQDALEEEKSRKTRIYVAKVDILAGQTFTEENVESQEIQALKCPTDAIASIERLIGEKSKYDIPKGRLISEHDIVAKIEKKDAKDKISPVVQK